MTATTMPGSAVPAGTRSDRLMKQVLWWLGLFLAPVVLMSIELFHPSGFTAKPGMYAFLSHAEHDPRFHALDYFGPNWWLTLHMIQTPLVGLVAVGLWSTVAGVGGADGAPAALCAWLARLSIFLMLIYFTVLDGIGGIGLGRTILVVQQLAADGKLTPAQLDGIELLLNTLWADPVTGGIGSFVSLTASWAAFSAAFFIAATLLLTRRANWAIAALLLAFGWELQTAHASPHGPVAFALLVVASGWLWWRQQHPGASPAAAS